MDCKLNNCSWWSEKGCTASDEGAFCPLKKMTESSSAEWQDHDAALIAKDDDITNPSHYTYGKIECIDYIRDKNFDFCLGNAIKYITRAGRKGDAIKDLRKAIQYIEFEIEKLGGWI